MRIKFAMMLVLAALGVMAGCGGDETPVAEEKCSVPAGLYVVAKSGVRNGEEMDFEFDPVSFEIKQDEMKCGWNDDLVIKVNLKGAAPEDRYIKTSSGYCALENAELRIDVFGLPYGVWYDDGGALFLKCAPSIANFPDDTTTRVITAYITIKPDVSSLVGIIF
jgi:hypothetical protein